MHIDLTSVQATVNYINTFGIYGPLAAFMLFFIQAAIPVIPYIFLAGAAGMIFGKAIGFLLAWIGALVGALFLYFISHWLGKIVFIQKLRDKYEFDLQNVNQKHVFWVLLISRIFPVVPTPIINIGSGLGGVRFSVFALSSALGKLPWAFIYVVLGDYLLKSKNITNTLLIVALILIISVIGIYYYRNRIPIHKKSEL